MWIPGPKLTQVFASRWKALFWAASILISAYFFIPKQGAQEDDDNAQAMSMASRLLPGDASSSASSQPSPWAADSAAS
jgi:hypothetical protein